MDSNKIVYIKELMANVDAVDWKSVGLNIEYNRGFGEFECSLRESFNTLTEFVNDKSVSERLSDSIDFQMNNREVVKVGLDAILIDLLESIQHSDMDEAEGYLSELQVYIRINWEQLKK